VRTSYIKNNAYFCRSTKSNGGRNHALHIFIPCPSPHAHTPLLRLVIQLMRKHISVLLKQMTCHSVTEKNCSTFWWIEVYTGGIHNHEHYSTERSNINRLPFYHHRSQKMWRREDFTSSTVTATYIMLLITELCGWWFQEKNSSPFRRLQIWKGTAATESHVEQPLLLWYTDTWILPITPYTSRVESSWTCLR
jgi:hypothetical protein